MRRPLLPSHFAIWFEPPDEQGDEILHIRSEQRSLKLKGYAFREFYERVVPLLDGSRSLEEIHAETADVFRLQDLDTCLELLRDNGVLVDAPANGEPTRLTPQRNLFHEFAPGVDVQRRLAEATVAVVGLGGAGPTVAATLASAGVGRLRCHDALPVTATDVYHAPFLGIDAVGAPRAERVAALARATAPEVSVHAETRLLESEDDLRAAVAGIDFVVCCLDASQVNLAFKLNRACLAEGVRWIACSLAGAEVVVGPSVDPGRSACYLCYRMRSVACATSPEDAFAFERFLDRRRDDDSGRRENLVFSAGIVGNLVGLEVVKTLTGFAEPSLVGRILTLRLTDLTVQRHTVLRKPGCPACFPMEEPAGG